MITKVDKFAHSWSSALPGSHLMTSNESGWQGSKIVSVEQTKRTSALMISAN